MTSPTRDGGPRPAATAAVVVAAVAVGALIATQTRLNGELGSRLGDGFTAAAISFGSGLVVLATALLALPAGRRGLGRLAGAIRSGRMPWWHLLGGVGGAVFVLGQGLLGAILGVALFTVGIVAGQTVSSLLIDRRGLGSMPARPLSAQRMLGAVLAIAAVVAAGSGEPPGRAPIVLVIVPVLIGLLVGGQAALNGEVRVVAGSAVSATLVNFAVGSVILVAAAVVHAGIAGWPSRYPAEPWLYLGGVAGVVFIAAQTVIVRILGVLVMGLALLAGQLGAAVVFDLVVPLPGDGITAVTVAGAAVTLGAVGIAAVPGRRARRVRASSGGAPR